jgi:hypothetical protein
MENPFSTAPAKPSAEHTFDGYNWDFIRLVEERTSRGENELRLYDLDAWVHRFDPSRVEANFERLWRFRVRQLRASVAA